MYSTEAGELVAFGSDEDGAERPIPTAQDRRTCHNGRRSSLKSMRVGQAASVSRRQTDHHPARREGTTRLQTRASPVSRWDIVQTEDVMEYLRTSFRGCV